MQAQKVRTWFIAIFLLVLSFNKCGSHQNKNKKNKSSLNQESFDDKPEGKIFGWKKQPQTNVIFITRPTTALPTTPIVSTTSTAFTSPVAPVAPALTTVRRPYAQRYGGYRQVPVRRRNQGYRRQQPWHRRRVWGYGREEEKEEEQEVEVGKVENGNALVENEVKVKDGVSAKLDIEQLEKSLLSQQNAYTDNDAGEIEVAGDDLNKPLKVKSKRPQIPVILADTATSNEPTYADIVVHSNMPNKKLNQNGGGKRQTIWQGIRQAWRERRDRQKSSVLKKQQQQEQDDVVRDNEIFIDENGEIHIRKRHKYNNYNNRQKNTKQKQKKKRKQEIEDIETTSENSFISENNTNSRFQNIMNAFRRTPIIYKQNSR